LNATARSTLLIWTSLTIKIVNTLKRFNLFLQFVEVMMLLNLSRAQTSGPEQSSGRAGFEGNKYRTTLIFQYFLFGFFIFIHSIFFIIAHEFTRWNVGHDFQIFLVTILCIFKWDFSIFTRGFGSKYFLIFYYKYLKWVYEWL